MEEEGELVEAGPLRVDRRRALAKLARFRLADPRDFVCSLVRTAVLSGASRVAFDASPARLDVDWDGTPPAPALLRDPLAGLLGPSDVPGAAHLGSAYLGALQSRPVSVEAAVRVPGREQAVRWRRDGRDEEVPLPAGLSGTRLSVRWRYAVPLGLLGRLRLRCRSAPLALLVEGRELGPPPGAVTLQEGAARLVVWPAPAQADKTELRPYVDGAGADPAVLESRWPPVHGSLLAEGLSLDASLAKAVRGEAFARAAADAERALEGLPPLLAAGHAADLPRIRAALGASDLRDCWAAEDAGAARNGPSRDERVWIEHAARRTRWLQEAAALSDALRDTPLFPAWDGAWDGDWLSPGRLQAVAERDGRVLAASASPSRRWPRGEVVRLYRPGDLPRLRRALRGAGVVDVTPSD